jgi:hypothetical protein
MLPRSLPEHHALAPLPRPFPQFQSELISRRREVGEAPRKEEAFEDAYHVVRTAARGRRIVWPVCVLSRIHATVPEGAWRQGVRRSLRTCVSGPGTRGRIEGLPRQTTVCVVT